MILARRSGTRQALRKMGQLPILSALILSIVVVGAIMAPWIAPHDPRVSRPQDRLEPPVWMDGGSAKYLLGDGPFRGETSLAGSSTVRESPC